MVRKGVSTNVMPEGGEEEDRVDCQANSSISFQLVAGIGWGRGGGVSAEARQATISVSWAGRQGEGRLWVSSVFVAAWETVRPWVDTSVHAGCDTTLTVCHPPLPSPLTHKQCRCLDWNWFVVFDFLCLLSPARHSRVS
ncbi:hypothetical protein ElyMa_001566500 [Elysia marginata]|uniref:SRCR domain-containing protein n=1 Tax=Elysia marginata TaxID=1093978 RepID=A0AAV4JES7_9GAST|nr:hypothetical protein ElyMa_001566500 [Elysia marginata]